jgi:hypothetical protein
MPRAIAANCRGHVQSITRPYAACAELCSNSHSRTEQVNSIESPMYVQYLIAKTPDKYNSTTATRLPTVSCPRAVFLRVTFLACPNIGQSEASPPFHIRTPSARTAFEQSGFQRARAHTTPQCLRHSIQTDNQTKDMILLVSNLQARSEGNPAGN